MLDLLVIGAGLSGLTAALAAAQAGRRVRVIAKGLGTPLWSAGTLDLLGYLPDRTPVHTPQVDIPLLPAEHPLCQVGAATAARALAELAGQLSAAGLPYVGVAPQVRTEVAPQVRMDADDGANLWLPSAVGSARPVYRAPAAQAVGRLDDPSPLLLVGFRGLRDFYPQLIAENLQRQGHAARSAQLPLSLLTHRHDSNSVHLAHALEEPAPRQALAEALRAHVKPGERIGLPAFLGVDQHVTVWQELQEQVGAPIFEIPMLPPSVPGMRLVHVLRKLLSDLGVRIELNMEAVGFGADGRRITWVESAASARPLRHHARAFLLATGGILGGGFHSGHDTDVSEAVFGLPLTTPPQRDDWFATSFLDPAGHPVFSGGVTVTEGWQPCDTSGTAQFNNLWAAGNLLAHADAIRTRSVEGLAIATASAAISSYLVADKHISPLTSAA